MKIAVVHNTGDNQTVYPFGRTNPEKYGIKTIANVVRSLTESGHEVTEILGDINLLDSLAQFFHGSEDGNSAQPDGLVFNMAYGVQGECRYTHVPAMLETGGIPYTGSSPLGHTLALDKVITKLLIQAAGVPTPAFKVFSGGDINEVDLRYPLIVKPRYESTSYGLRLVTCHDELREAVEAIVAKYRQDALVEEYIDGREVCIGLLGNGSPQCLPAVEIDFGTRESRLNTLADKFHKVPDEPDKICPAPLGTDFLSCLNDLAVKTFKACHLKDYARVDIRIDQSGNPFVLEINSMASLGEGGSFVKAATTAGYTYSELIQRIVAVTVERYRVETRASGNIDEVIPIAPQLSIALV